MKRPVFESETGFILKFRNILKKKNTLVMLIGTIKIIAIMIVGLWPLLLNVE
jgi:hypothetical protein